MTSAGRSRGRATIVDVARAAEVSRQTVSNVVNNPQRVAPATLERVHREIERLGFRPSLAARSLKQERANALGIELNSLGVRRLGSILDSFFVELTVASRQRDAHLVPFAAAEHDRPIPAYQDLVASNLVDAFILTDTRHDDPRPGWLREHGIPFAAFGRIWDDPGFTWWVDVDGFAGVATAVQHLLGAGYDRVGFLGWPAGSPVGDERRAGWLGAAADAGGDHPGGRPAPRRTSAWPRRPSPRHRRDGSRRRGGLCLGHARDGRLDGAARARPDAGARLRHRRLRRQRPRPGLRADQPAPAAARGRRGGAGHPRRRPRRPADARGGTHPPTHPRHRGSTDRSTPPSAGGTWHHADNRTDNGGNR